MCRKTTARSKWKTWWNGHSYGKCLFSILYPARRLKSDTVFFLNKNICLRKFFFFFKQFLSKLQINFKTFIIASKSLSWWNIWLKIINAIFSCSVSVCPCPKLYFEILEKKKSYEKKLKQNCLPSQNFSLKKIKIIISVQQQSPCSRKYYDTQQYTSPTAQWGCCWQWLISLELKVLSPSVKSRCHLPRKNNLNAGYFGNTSTYSVSNSLQA